MKGGYVYIMTNKPQGTLYVGVTRTSPGGSGSTGKAYTTASPKRYGLKRLAHYEFYDDIRNALQREKNLKHWPRLWKLALIYEFNPKVGPICTKPSILDLGLSRGRDLRLCGDTCEARLLDARLKAGQDAPQTCARRCIPPSCTGLTRACRVATNQRIRKSMDGEAACKRDPAQGRRRGRRV